MPREGAEAQPQWTVMAHIDTRGGLAQAADLYERRLRTACERRGYGLAVQRLSAVAAPSGGVVASLRVWSGGAWQRHGEVRVADLPEAIARAGPAALRSLPAHHVLVVVVAHGTGLMEAREGDRGARALGRALTAVATAWGRPLDVLGLDTCFGASLEDLWELRQVAATITAAPGLIYSPGLRWDQGLVSAGADDPRELARTVTQLGMSQGTADEALVSVETARLPEIMAAVRDLTTACDGRMPGQGHAITLVRSRTRSWGRRNELCDLAGLAAGLADNTDDPALLAAAPRVETAVGESLIASWWGGGAANADLRGLGVYFPPTFEEIPASYGGLEFARESGWYRFLQQYWEWLSAPVLELTNPPH